MIIVDRSTMWEALIRESVDDQRMVEPIVVATSPPVLACRPVATSAIIRAAVARVRTHAVAQHCSIDADLEPELWVLGDSAHLLVTFERLLACVLAGCAGVVVLRLDAEVDHLVFTASAKHRSGAVDDDALALLFACAVVRLHGGALHVRDGGRGLEVRLPTIAHT